MLAMEGSPINLMMMTEREMSWTQCAPKWLLARYSDRQPHALASIFFVQFIIFNRSFKARIVLLLLQPIPVFIYFILIFYFQYFSNFIKNQLVRRNSAVSSSG